MRALLASLLGLAAVRALAANPLSLDTAGTVWDGVYSSPDGAFQLRAPALLLPGARIGDAVTADGSVEVSFADDLCREFRLRRTPLVSPPANAAELKRIVAERSVPDWGARYAATPEGKASEIRLERAPAVAAGFRTRTAPCAAFTGEGAAEVVAGRILLYVFVEANALYEAAYVSADLPRDLYAFLPEAGRPPKELLQRFIAGLATGRGPAVPGPASAPFATIDVGRSNELMRALRGDETAAAKTAAAQLEAAPGSYTPPALLALADRRRAEGRNDEAGFWFVASRLRAQVDAAACADELARDQVEGLFVGSPIERELLANPVRLQSILSKAADWDAATPRTYDPRWPYLLGAAALAAHLGLDLGEQAARPPAAASPPAAAEAGKARAAFVEWYTSGIAKERERRAVRWTRWERVTEDGGTVFYADFATLTADGALRSVWEVRDHDVMRTSGAWSYLNQNQYDCDRPRYRSLYFSSQSAHMGGGQLVQWYPWTGEWNEGFPPESPAEQIRRAVCSRPLPGPAP